MAACFRRRGAIVGSDPARRPPGHAPRCTRLSAGGGIGVDRCGQTRPVRRGFRLCEHESLSESKRQHRQVVPSREQGVGWTYPQLGNGYSYPLPSCNVVRRRPSRVAWTRCAELPGRSGDKGNWFTGRSLTSSRAPDTAPRPGWRPPPDLAQPMARKVARTSAAPSPTPSMVTGKDGPATAAAISSGRTRKGATCPRNSSARAGA